MGRVYWPGLRDGDWYSMTSRAGSGASIALTLVNSSGLARLQYAWGMGESGTTDMEIRNDATGQYVDGLGAAANGAAAGQENHTGSADQQCNIVNDGSYVQIENLATGLYLDGMGRTANGSAVGQYAYSGSPNQQWTVAGHGNTVYLVNRATGMYVDDLGSTTNGA